MAGIKLAVVLMNINRVMVLLYFPIHISIILSFSLFGCTLFLLLLVKEED